MTAILITLGALGYLAVAGFVGRILRSKWFDDEPGSELFGIFWPVLGVLLSVQGFGLLAQRYLDSRQESKRLPKANVVP